ncbi:hypothetical protein ACIA49_28285 [Kribbella sp. NPDC051587]|uniref:hypothetical protein n=1 Tax=Kribbella sp. NPDC051587 TaxID=3364119 RepID=UPI0037986288
MRKIMTLTASLAVLTTILTGQASAAPAPATAARASAVMAPTGTAELSRDIYLSIDAPVGSTASWSRSIDLAKGSYKWQLVMTGMTGALERPIDLEKGTYEWVVTVTRVFTTGHAKYDVQTTLKQSCCPQALLRTRLYTPASGTYHIGSLLIQN